MDNNTQPNSLPEKVVRRHFEILSDILPEFSALVIQEGRPADTLLNAWLRSRRELGSRDRRFLAQAIFSYFRWYGWTVARLQLEPVAAALLGTALDVEDLPQSFQYLESRCSLPFSVEPMAHLDLEEKRTLLNEQFKSLPDFRPLQHTDLVIPGIGGLISRQQIEPCIQAFQQRPPAWIRCRTDAGELLSALTEKGIQAHRHATMPQALSVEAGVSLEHALSGQGGRFVVQDIGSQLVGCIADPQPANDWWDCCAGSGGKALHLMDLMQQNGKVLASDVRLPVLKELKKRARKYGIKNIRTQPFNAVNDEPFTKTFDGVLVDAPCSGWGTWSRNPDARWRASRRDVVQCAARQLKILSNVKWCVKPGGTLVYAVCTVTRPETEEVVMNFLDQHENFSLAPFTNPLNGEPTGGQLQIWPWEGPGDGMFIAKFVRKAD